ncbi:hypothetical protein CDD83_7039 [Cordyceps sp. RAO-2017]|nr:hypothetical protein CDD83_7039 [Cordyceps sp. RAO-2017]
MMPAAHEADVAPAIHGCQAFNKITVWLQIAGDSGDGTWSQIYMSFGNQESQLIKIADGPHAGDCSHRNIPLQAAYGTPVVPVDLVTQVRIWDVSGDSTMAFLAGADAWVIESLRIDAQCSNLPKTLSYQSSTMRREVAHDKLHVDTPTPVFTTEPIKPEDWIVPRDVAPSCRNDLLDTSLTVASTQCTDLEELKLGIELGHYRYQGTWDTLLLAFRDTDEEHVIASGPSPGFHEWQNIDLMRTFNRPTVALDHIKQVQIYQNRTSRWGGDEWTLQGIKLKGRCTGSLTEIELDKFASVNLDTPGADTQWYQAKRVWKGRIAPEKDWAVLQDCRHFDRLTVDFHQRGAVEAAPEDDLFVRLSYTGAHGEVRVADMPSPGQNRVDLKAVFGSDTVAVDDIRHFDVLSRAREAAAADAGVPVAGVTFRGRCAGPFKKEFIADKYKEFHDWFGSDENALLFRHSIALEDWHLLDPVTKQRIKADREF